MVNDLHYLPLLTTAFSAVFFVVLVKHWQRSHSGVHILWWAAGVFTYGLGTLVESTITLHGNTAFLNKAWYITGALLGGYPLAQGVAYLLLKRKTANVLAGITLPVLCILSLLVLLSPTDYTHLDITKPGGAALGWQWIRWTVPFINLYAFAMLVGGAIISAWRYAKTRSAPERVKGNILIAIGGLLPGMGGGLAAAGVVEALYVLELVGIIFIWLGYQIIASAPKNVIHLDFPLQNSTGSSLS